MSFNYYPKVTSIADPYSNYNSGGVKYILNEPNVVQFKTDTDEAFRSVATEMQRLEAEIHGMRVRQTQLLEENHTLVTMMKWISQHFPEALQALDSTMKVTVKLDEANDYGDITMETMEAP